MLTTILSPLCRFMRPALSGLAALAAVLTLSAAEAARKNFDLPAGPAGETLKAFARQAGREIVFSAEAVGNIPTKVVFGEFTPREAIDQMLADTGLVASQDTRTGAFAVRKLTGSEAKNVPSRIQTQATSHADVSGEKPTDTLELDPYSVTVTVQKRPQEAQDVPIAMTSLSYRTLDRFKVESLRDLSRLTPNFLVSAFNNTSPTIAIRGATNTFTQIGVNKPVAVVIDDVFIPRNSAATFELYDLDSVQILRGPQGTLFGRNVTGGAVVLNTRQPVIGARAAAASIETGNFNRQKYDGMVSMPLGRNMAASLTASQNTRDGYGRDRLNGRELDDLNSSSIRGQLLVQPGSEFKVLLRADYADDRTGGRTLSSKGVGNDGNRRTAEIGIEQGYARNIWGASANLDWQVAAGNFTSITAYRESQSGETFSGTGVSYTFLTGGSQTVNRDVDNPGTFSQELRYASPKWARGDFVAGLYFLDEAAHRNLHIRAFAAGSGNLVANQTIDQKVDTASLAGYLDGTWRITPSIGLTLGARYTSDRKEAAIVRVDNVVSTRSFTANGLSTRWSEFTPRAVVTWQPGKAVNLYGSVTRGFTSGGYNTEAATAAIAAVPFSPETVTNYEVGLKAQLWDKRLRANLAVFHEKYADKQELFFNTPTQVLTIVNASAATMNGAEVELLFTPVKSLAVSVAYGRLDATYDSFVLPGVFNNTGNPLGSSPRNKFSAGVDYQVPLADKWGAVSLTASYSWTDDYYTGATKDPNLFVPAYSLGNASLRWDSADGHWRVSLWGKNLADTEYLLTPSTQGVLAEYLGEPRTYGVSLSWRY